MELQGTKDHLIRDKICEEENTHINIENINCNIINQTNNENKTAKMKGIIFTSMILFSIIAFAILAYLG